MTTRITSVVLLDVDAGKGFVLVQTTDPDAAWQRVRTAFETEAAERGDAAVYANRLANNDVLLYQENGETAAIATMLDANVMVATDLETATRVMAVHQGTAPSLADRADYQQLTNVAAGNYIAFGFVAGQTALDDTLANWRIYDALDEVADVWHGWGLGDPNSFTLDSGVAAARGVLDAALGEPMVLRVEVGADALAIHHYQVGGATEPIPDYQPLDADRVPTDALVFAGGYDLYGGYYLPIVNAMDRALTVQGDDSVAAARREAENALGFDPEFHIASLLDGRFAGALTIDLNDPDMVTGQLFVEVNDPLHMQGSLAELDQIADDHGLTAGTVMLAGREARLYGSYGSGATGYALDGNELTVEMSSDIDGVFARPATARLSDDAAYQAIMQLLPDGALGFAYINVGQVVDALDAAGNLPDLSNVAVENWRAIDAAGVAVTRRAGVDETIVVLHLGGADGAR